MKKNKQVLIAWILLIPAIAIFLLMIVYPFINSIVFSFTDKSLIYPNTKFIGFDNYREILKNSYLLDLLRTTLIFVLSSTILPFLIGLIWAVIMNQKFKGSEFLRGLTLVNWIIPGIAISFLWTWIFNGDYGILNAILIKLGLIDHNIVWLGGRSTSMVAVVVARTWQMFPWYMTFILGGLQGVSKDQIEATRIDGANNWQNFIHVILPEILPILKIVFIMGLITNFQHFDLIRVMTGGGPQRATATFSTEVYRTAFQEYNVGKAAALGVIWALVLTLFSSVYLKRMKED